MPKVEYHALVAGRRTYGGRSADERAGERRRRLIDAALELYGTRGYAATSIEQLCAEANVSTRSFYEEVGSREKLLVALADDITSRAAAAVMQTLEGLDDVEIAKRVSACLHAYLDVTCADERTGKVCYVEVVGVSAAVEEWRRSWRNRMAELFVTQAEEAAERGELAKRDYRLFAIAVVGAVNSLAQEWVAGGADRDEVIAELVHLVLSGSVH